LTPGDRLEGFQVNGDEHEGSHGSAYVPDDHVGVHLRARRIEQGRELADIAHQTRVPLRHLIAIEEGLHDTLPALPYTVGFVKSYARAVGLDTAECAERFRAETTKSDRIVPMMSIEPIEESRVPTRSAALIGVLLLGAIVLAAIAYGAGWFSGGEPEPAPVVSAENTGSSGGAPVAADTQAAPPASVPAAVPATAPPATAPTGQVVIAAREDAWVKIYDRTGGAAVFMGVMAAGDRYEVPADRQDLLLWTGRAGALDITVGGVAIAPLGAPTETVRDVSLTAEALAARVRPTEG
jgi:cytoskeleton protein RodZ